MSVKGRSRDAHASGAKQGPKGATASMGVRPTDGVADDDDSPGRPRRTSPEASSALATRVATGGILVAGVLGALFLLPPPGWAIVAMLIVAGAAHEWAALAGLGPVGRLALAAATLAGCAALLWLALPLGWSSALVVPACGAATLFWLCVGTPSVLAGLRPASAVALGVAGWVVLLGAFAAVAALQARSPWIALAAMALVWVADTAAYFSGRRFGRRKLAPAISPGKTREGAYGGIAAVALYALLVLSLAGRNAFPDVFGGARIVPWTGFAVALAALSIVGDLYESQLKRRAGVKDSGALLPGHGGILDRIDALLAAMPPAALATTLLLTQP